MTKAKANDWDTNRFSTEVVNILSRTHQHAVDFNHQSRDVDHMLLATIEIPDNALSSVIDSFGISAEAIRHELLRLKPIGNARILAGKLSLSMNAKSAIEYSIFEADRLQHDVVDTPHLLLGILSVEHSSASRILNNLEFEPCCIHAAVMDIM